MKKTYIEPQFQIEAFQIVDVITLSENAGTGGMPVIPINE